MDNRELISGYDVFVNGEWDLSPFEHLFELNCRDIIQEQIDDFSEEEREEVKRLDQILIERSPLFYRALKGFLEQSRRNKPKSFWWWYLE
jgi:hypothetical protein